MPRPVQSSRTVRCRASAEALWPRLADTERLNRAAGQTHLTVEPLTNAGAARYLVRTRLDGFPVEYEERPFEWVENRSFRVHRRVRKGAVRDLTFQIELLPLASGGTDVTLTLTILPRWFFVWPAVVLGVRGALGRMAREVERVDQEIARAAPRPAPPGAPRPGGSPLQRAGEALRAAILAADLPVAERLLAQVAQADDWALSRMRPFELADDWRMDRDQVLAVCLQAVVVGLLDMAWELLCPSCRTGVSQAVALSEIPKDGHCQFCELSFGVSLDLAVEATFRPAPAVRPLDLGPYCIGGPARTPHVVAQAVLPASGQAELQVPLEAGRYRLFIRGGAVALVDVTPEAGATVLVAAGEAFPSELSVAPGGLLRLTQGGGEERHAKLERSEWVNLAATAHHVSLSPTFRRLFSKDVLRPGMLLQVSRVALLFTDLTDSTALYTRAGDAVAFKLVQDHFDLLREAVERHKGTVVKTIGDAIMAAFLDDEHALRAALEMQRCFVATGPSFEGARLQLKLGVYAGPCFAVTANGLLDYFGQSVNIAARLQGAAGPGEIVLPSALADRALAEGWLGAESLVERFPALLKGLGEPVLAARLRPPAG
jgi:adenylate cyclase